MHRPAPEIPAYNEEAVYAVHITQTRGSADFGSRYRGCFRARLSGAADGTEGVGSTPQQFAAHMKAERTKWIQAIKQAGIKLQ
jgi:predicted adenine nucleotide alpha hydrolase (AANH) superfamily ATPase